MGDWEMVLAQDAMGNAGKHAYENGPFDSDTVTNTHVNGLRTVLVLQQPTGVWTNDFIHVLRTFLTACAPSEAWCLLQGESPCRARNSQPPVPSVGVMTALPS